MTNIENLTSAGKSELNAISTRLSPSIFDRVSLSKCASMSTYRTLIQISSHDLISAATIVSSPITPLTWSPVSTVL